MCAVLLAAALLLPCFLIPAVFAESGNETVQTETESVPASAQYGKKYKKKKKYKGPSK